MSVANRLIESGHYASQQIKQIASQLEQEWKAFAAALDERSTLLDMSSIFHQKVEQVSEWGQHQQKFMFWNGELSSLLLLWTKVQERDWKSWQESQNISANFNTLLSSVSPLGWNSPQNTLPTSVQEKTTKLGIWIKMKWTEMLKYIKFSSIDVMPFLHLEAVTCSTLLTTPFPSVLKCQDLTHNNFSRKHKLNWPESWEVN